MHDDRSGGDRFGRSIQRIRPEPKQGLNPEDIAARTEGNYMLSFGFPGSGKTTFQWMLMNYLMNEGAFRTTIHVPDGADGPDWEGRRIVNEWKEQWIEGRFPEPTRASEADIREIAVHVEPGAGRRLALDFSFLEVSGELLRLALPEPGRGPHLVPLIRACFENPRLKFVLMLMLHPDVEENDKLFPSFISFLDKEFPRLRERMSLGVIVSKPEASLARLREFGSAHGRRDYPRFDEEALEDYLNRFCGETWQIWSNWPDQRRVLLSPLYLGEIQQMEGEPRLVAPDFNHIEQIFLWVFERFTGKRPGPTLWQKMRGQLDWT